MFQRLQRSLIPDASVVDGTARQEWTPAVSMNRMALAMVGNFPTRQIDREDAVEAGIGLQNPMLARVRGL